MFRDMTPFCVTPEMSVHDVVARMDRNRLGVALVVDPERRLLGTVSDGDVRRSILANVNLAESVSALLARKVGTRHERPVTAPIGKPPATYAAILQQHNLLYLPLLDETGRVDGLVTLDQLVPGQRLPVQAVVMAGGKGSRLHPLTEDTPKPLLRVGDQSILEIILKQLREAGIRQVKVTTHHHQEKIAEQFGDGKDFGMELSYLAEDRPLGTIGGLGLLETPKDTTLVINGDILTQTDFRAMVVYHREHEADLTVAVRHYEVKVPYGVIECEGAMVRRVNEKPALGFFVNAGIYLLQPIVYRYIPNGQRFDMTDLIQRLVSEGRTVVSFPVREYWLDIGQREDYEQAQAEIKQWSAR